MAIGAVLVGFCARRISDLPVCQLRSKNEVKVLLSGAVEVIFLLPLPAAGGAAGGSTSNHGRFGHLQQKYTRAAENQGTSDVPLQIFKNPRPTVILSVPRRY